VSGLPEKPNLRLRLTNPVARQQAFEAMGKVIRRRDGQRYLVVGFKTGDESDAVTLNPNAAETDETIEVDW
jgi:hypothetical protein